MDFFHWTTKIVSRNKGKSAVAASAYISGTKMENTWDGVTHDYTRKKHVIYTEVMLPPTLHGNMRIAAFFGTALNGMKPRLTPSSPGRLNWRCPLS